VTAEYIAAMEDVLDLYAEDYNEQFPVVCFDETSKQLVRELRPRLVAESGKVERFDYEYKRGGVANLFMMCEPKSGWRHIEVTERHTRAGFCRTNEVVSGDGISARDKDSLGDGQSGDAFTRSRL
jgi:hypothetical protein